MNDLAYHSSLISSNDSNTRSLENTISDFIYALKNETDALGNEARLKLMRTENLISSKKSGLEDIYFNWIQEKDVARRGPMQLAMALNHLSSAQKELSSSNREASWSHLCRASKMLGHLHSENEFLQNQDGGLLAKNISRSIAGKSRNVKMKIKAIELVKGHAPSGRWPSFESAVEKIYPMLEFYEQSLGLSQEPSDFYQLLRTWKRNDPLFAEIVKTYISG